MSIPKAAVAALQKQLKKDAEQAGYHLNPDKGFTESLVTGLLTNQARYGYRACPCRLATGSEHEDRDIICPCDYRDQDLDEFDSCYCALYVSEDVVKGKKKPHSIPERRPPREERKHMMEPVTFSTKMPVWRCKVCGYLCARESPPEICPICKAKDRWERFT